jgi:hypothetical protein
MPDGTVFLGGKLEQLRILSSDGTLIWQSGVAARQGSRLLSGVARG